MGVRYTDSKIVFVKTIRSDSSAHMLADIDAAMVLTGVPRGVVTGGFKYTLLSPDGLGMKLFVQDLGESTIFNTFIRFTAKSQDETETGKIQLIISNDDVPFTVWANCCQFFLAPTHDAGMLADITFACGVPSLPPSIRGASCTQDLAGIDVTDLWWTSSNGDGAFTQAANFRDQRYAAGSFTLAYNGTVYIAPGNSDIERMGLAPLCVGTNVDISYRSDPPSVKYGTEQPLRIDALLELSGQGYGQLWDAFQRATTFEIDSTYMYTEDTLDGGTLVTNWTVWNNVANGLATLLLLVSKTKSGGSSGSGSIVNVAY